MSAARPTRTLPWRWLGLTPTAVLLALISVASAQVGGVSNSKILVLSAETVPSRIVEFEPAFAVARTTREFGGDGERMSLGGTQVESSLGFRITAGLLETLEAGVTVPSGMDEVALGGKLRVLSSERLALALLGGFTFTTGTVFDSTSAPLEDRFHLATVGAVGTYGFSERLSLDLDGAVGFAFSREDPDPDRTISFNAGAGYMATDRLQGIVELGGMVTQLPDDEPAQWTLGVTPGFTYQASGKTLVIAGVTLDLAGRNAPVTTTSALAITFAIE